jgi:Flp pilus assembly protein TadG
MRLLRSERGSSLVEFAIVAPVFIFLLVGIIEIGRYTFFAILVANAARAGVQYGAQNTFTAQDIAGMTNAALQDANPLPQMSASPSFFCETQAGAITPCPASGATPAPNSVYYVEVVTTGTFKSLLSYPGIPNNIPISGKAIMPVISQ